ncbi:MAG: gliding motility-associated C-terminal domain-containing protein [Bacteroidales bacterium]|nr:gliding motility-associated C-terminal domain-containing protein [Bacteroidales bacterium]
MRKILPWILVPLFTPTLAAMTAVGSAPYAAQPAAASGLEQVFVFNGLDGAGLSHASEQPDSCRWYRYTNSFEDAVELPAADITRTAAATTLGNLSADCGYYVEEAGQRHAVYVIDYRLHPCQYAGLVPVTEAEDITESLQIIVSGCADDLSYRGLDGRRYYLSRRHRLRYTDVQWDASSLSYRPTEIILEREGYLSGISVDAPLDNTVFELSGDQFADYFSLTGASVTASYTAVKVVTHAQATVVEGERGENEVGGGVSGLSGPAPLEVNFMSLASPAATHTVWYIYTTPGSTDDYLYRNETDISYTFSRAGTFTVKLKASNDVSSDSASFSVTVTESFLDCPNFFTPRSTPGENDEFRVAYRSLVKFHGRIMNRWGNVLFEWRDPSQGWDGTWHGRPVSPGVYFYVITATGSDGVEYARKGDINLLE